MTDRLYLSLRYKERESKIVCVRERERERERATHLDICCPLPVTNAETAGKLFGTLAF